MYKNFHNGYKKSSSAKIQSILNLGSASLGYSVMSVCLEEDGTLIETDRILCSCSTKTLMLLGAEHAWRGSPRGLISFPSSADISSFPNSTIDQFEMYVSLNSLGKSGVDDFWLFI